MTLFSMNGRPIEVGDRVRLHATEDELKAWAIDWLSPSSAEGTVLHADLREGGVLPVLVRFDSLNTGRWVPPENLEHLSPADPEPEFKPGDKVYVPKDAMASYGPVVSVIAGRVVTLKTLDDGESPSDAQVYIPGSEGDAGGAVSVLAEWLRKPEESVLAKEPAPIGEALEAARAEAEEMFLRAEDRIRAAEAQLHVASDPTSDLRSWTNRLSDRLDDDVARLSERLASIGDRPLRPAASPDGRKILGSPIHVAPAETPLDGGEWKPLGTISEDGLSVDWGDSGGPLVDTAAIEVALESNRPFTPPRIELCGEDLLNLLDSKVLTSEEARTLLGF